MWHLSTRVVSIISEKPISTKPEIKARLKEAEDMTPERGAYAKKMEFS